jgi:transketolase N-terminal domain/subunit
MDIREDKIKELELKANDIRQSIIEMLVEAKSGHTAGPLGMADIFTALYFHVLNHKPLDPEWSDRDRLILSNGHIVPVRYATMAHAGYFPLEELKTLRKFGSRLQVLVWDRLLGMPMALAWIIKNSEYTASCLTAKWKKDLHGNLPCLQANTNYRI